MIHKIEIRDIKDLSDVLFEQQYDSKIGRYRSAFLYRGLPNADYPLVTSLKRNCKEKQSELERSILRNFTKYATIDDPKLKDSVWRQLIVGQHHGLPTRLLDWTYSPLMAMHFATSGGGGLDQMDKNDSAIWKVHINEVNSLLPDGYKEILRREKAFFFTSEWLEKIAHSLSKYDSDMEDRSMVFLEPPSIDPRIISQYS